jgi:hypothetical protein
VRASMRSFFTFAQPMARTASAWAITTFAT